jgi:hypothetical protein
MSKAKPEGRYEEFTPATIAQVVYEISEGEAHPLDARRLLELFCQQRLPSEELLEHVRGAFRQYLSGEKTLDAALGLTRTQGQPKADEKRQTLLALKVLESRLAGKKHKAAVDLIANKIHRGTTAVSDAWRDYKETARSVLLIRLALSGKSLTSAEQQRMEAIYK